MALLGQNEKKEVEPGWGCGPRWARPWGCGLAQAPFCISPLPLTGCHDVSGCAVMLSLPSWTETFELSNKLNNSSYIVLSTPVTDMKNSN